MKRSQAHYPLRLLGAFLGWMGLLALDVFPEEPANIIRNGTFEADDAGARPAAWSAYNYPLCVVTNAASPFGGGKKCLMLSWLEGPQGEAFPSPFEGKRTWGMDPLLYKVDVCLSRGGTFELSTSPAVVFSVTFIASKAEIRVIDGEKHIKAASLAPDTWYRIEILQRPLGGKEPTFDLSVRNQFDSEESKEIFKDLRVSSPDTDFKRLRFICYGEPGTVLVDNVSVEEVSADTLLDSSNPSSKATSTHPSPKKKEGGVIP